MDVVKPYLLDANAFIEAKNSYYDFEICPGFWESLIGHFESGNLHSIEYIQQELLRGNDDLADWVKNEAPVDFFRASQNDDVRRRYQEIILWVQRSTQFSNLAKADFAASADGWLIAYAWVNDSIVVTHEQLAPEVKSRVPIPNVCEQFGIEYKDTFFMLKALQVQFEWNA